jgi:hypothetical protein
VRVEALDDAVDGAEQDGPFTHDVGVVLALECRTEGVRRAERDRPAERAVGGLAVRVGVHGETAVDAGAVDLRALFVEAAHGVAHALGAHGDHPVSGRELPTGGPEMAEQEAVREADGRAGLQGREDLLVVGGEGGVGDQQDHQVAVGGDGEPVAECAVLLGEAVRAGVGGRRRAGAQSDAHLGCPYRRGSPAGCGPGRGPADPSR